MNVFKGGLCNSTLFSGEKRDPLILLWPENGMPVTAHCISNAQVADFSFQDGSDSEGCMPDCNPDSNELSALPVALSRQAQQKQESKASTPRMTEMSNLQKKISCICRLQYL